MASAGEKSLAVGHIPGFQIDPKIFLKILIGVQYEKEIQLLDKTHFAPAFSVV